MPMQTCHPRLAHCLAMGEVGPPLSVAHALQELEDVGEIPLAYALHVLQNARCGRRCMRSLECMTQLVAYQAQAPLPRSSAGAKGSHGVQGVSPETAVLHEAVAAYASARGHGLSRAEASTVADLGPRAEVGAAAAAIK
jgi:hypothetical protein